MKLEVLKFKTSKFYDVIDLSQKVKEFLEKVAAKEGLVNVFTRHTTVAIKINENEAGFLEDLKGILFKEVADLERKYLHNDTHIRDPKTICPLANGNDCLNGHSHVAQMFMGAASETIPVKAGEMLLGKWQRIMMFELDGAREREVIFSYVGTH